MLKTIMRAMLSSLVALLLTTSGEAAGQSFGGASIDSQGRVYVLDISGNVVLGAGAEKRNIISGSGLVMDVSVIHGNLVLSVRDDAMNGVLESYSLDGRKLRSVSLGHRFWPQRVAEFEERIAVLGTSPEEGTYIEFLDTNYNVMPKARLYASLECDDLGLVDMAVGQDGIYVAPLQYCGKGYLVRKFDFEGNVLTELAGSLRQSPNEPITDDDGHTGVTFTLAIKDVFVTPKYVGVVLNQLNDKGVPVDLWDHSGEFIERVEFPGVFSGVARVVPSSVDEVTVVGIEDEVIQINLTRLVSTKFGGTK